MVKVFTALLFLIVVTATSRAETGPASVPPPGRRLALVIGNGAYARAVLPTAVNDAGLVAETLAAAGFDVLAARDLDRPGLRRALHDILGRAAAAGPEAVVFVYLAGYGLQLAGADYIAPVGAAIDRLDDIPAQAIDLSAFVHALAVLPLRARIVVVDGAYANAHGPASGRLAPGLALIDPEPGTLVAFNAAPGAVAPTPARGPYGTFAKALVEMMRAGGVAIEDVFARTRLRVSHATQGASVPWDDGRLAFPFLFFDRATNTPALASVQQSLAVMGKRPAKAFPADEATSLAIATDTLPAYQDVLAAYPDSPWAPRLKAALALRREATLWRRSATRNSPDAYWTYLSLYPHGAHGGEARSGLTRLKAAAEPPSGFMAVADGLLPEPGVRTAAEPAGTGAAAFPALPAPPVLFLPPKPTASADLPAPQPADGRQLVPMPVPMPIPYVRPIVPPGRLMPPDGVAGQYAEPEPYATGPSGGVMARIAPDRPAGALGPRPEKPTRSEPAAKLSGSRAPSSETCGPPRTCRPGFRANL